ncbi:MAG: ATP-binding protein [Bacteroidetes bacterium]|nr:MAG: ATP-binding protein [Bacteroidota bacterium]
MLLEFTVGNFLSFENPVTLRLDASSITDYPENTFEAGKTQLLKSAAIYGANSSGKSNLIHAMRTMRKIMLDSAKLSSTDEIEVTPYLLNTQTENAPSFFEVLFFLNGQRYRYGFEVSVSKVHSEWLYHSKVKAEKMLFIRHHDGIEIADRKFPEGKNLESKTRDNALFLAVVDQFNGPTSGQIMEWFHRFAVISGLDHVHYRHLTFKMLKDKHLAPLLSSFIDQLDLGFTGIEVQELETIADFPIDFPKELIQELKEKLQLQKTWRLQTIHPQYNEKREQVGIKKFNLLEQESAGTNKLFDILGVFFDTLLNGGIIGIDEMDAKLHPILTKTLLQLFNSRENNRQNAQLIFVTHDTNLLSYGRLRRDQIYFTEKTPLGATDLYSLAEYKLAGKSVRKDRSFEKDYILGKYGAIPYLGDLSNIYEQWQEKLKSQTT